METVFVYDELVSPRDEGDVGEDLPGDAGLDGQEDDADVEVTEETGPDRQDDVPGDLGVDGLEDVADADLVEGDVADQDADILVTPTGIILRRGGIGTVGPRTTELTITTIILADEGFEFGSTLCGATICLAGGMTP